MSLDIAGLAADIVRNVGREFPAPPQEMILRQGASLWEEQTELADALDRGELSEIRGELADAVITCYMLAHYLQVDLFGELAKLPMTGWPTAPRQMGRVAGPLRRYLGIARRHGSLDELVAAIARAAAAVRCTAVGCGIDLDAAIADKAKVIFDRGWREASDAAAR